MSADDQIADGLYALTPEQFTSARDEQVKAARTAGNRVRAKELAALRKPTLAAWLVNLLVREDRQTLESFLALGDSLREAQQGMQGAELRELSVQRRKAVAALAARARELAASAGHPVTEATAVEAEATLNAALADPQSAEAVRAGRLHASLNYSGLGVAPDPAAATPAKSGPAAAPAVDRDELADRRAKAEQAKRDAAMSAAAAAVTEAETAVAECDRRLADAVAADGLAAREVTAAREKLQAAEGRARETAGALAAAKTERTRANRDLKTARAAAELR